MNDVAKLIGSIRRTAEKWLDPEHESRVKAELQLYSTEIRVTPEAVAFAVNQYMPQLHGSELDGLQHRPWDGVRKRIGVVQREVVPLAGLVEWLLVLLNGHEYVGLYKDSPDFLLQAFSDDVKDAYSDLPSSFKPIAENEIELSAILALGVEPDLLKEVEAICGGNESLPNLSRGMLYNVAVIDGHETRDEIEDLAEDVLMHEGRGEGNVRIIWAPQELNPDPYFESFAFFRGVYPAHDRTPGSLQMRKAFLAANDVPHAYGEGLEFLVSRGEPVNLEPCHIRWVPYNSLSEVHKWIEDNSDEIRSVVVRQKKHNQIKTASSLLIPGRAHRLAISEHDDTPLILDFLATI